MCKKLWQQLAITTLLTGGFSVLWGFLAIWGITMYETHMRQGFSYEDLAVDARGDAWIKVHNYDPALSSRNQLPYHTLEGEPIEVPVHDFWLSGCSLLGPVSNNRTENKIQNDWQRRIQKIASTGQEQWFLVHNGADADAGRAYLVGYDLLTKLPVGYCSRAGFRTELPEEDQWLRIDGRIAGYSTGNSAVISAQKNPIIALATLDGWFEFTVDQRLFRTIDDSHPYLSVNTCKIPLSAPRDKQDKPSNAEAETLNAQGEEFSPNWPEVFAARRQDHIVVQHPRQEQPFEFVIPLEYRERRIDFYFVSADHALLQTSAGFGINRKSLLLTTNAAGEIQKSQPIAWARRPQTSNRTASFLGILALPIPLVLSVIFIGVMPFQPIYQKIGWDSAGYWERLSLIMADAWPAALALVVISAALTWLALRWHRKYSRPNAGAWGALVFLLGIPGFMAYWAYRKRPVLEACQECGNRVPRDRDACAHCEQPFAAPALLGTEILT